MEKIYSDLKNPAGLASVEKLYQAAKKSNINVSRKQVESFLASQDSYTLHKQKKKRFFRRKFMFPKPGHTLLSDVAYMKEYQHCNTPFSLILLDGFSRYLSVHALNSLKSVEVAKVLDTF